MVRLGLMSFGGGRPIDVKCHRQHIISRAHNQYGLSRLMLTLIICLEAGLVSFIIARLLFLSPFPYILLWKKVLICSSYLKNVSYALKIQLKKSTIINGVTLVLINLFIQSCVYVSCRFMDVYVLGCSPTHLFCFSHCSSLGTGKFMSFKKRRLFDIYIIMQFFFFEQVLPFLSLQDGSDSFCIFPKAPDLE